TNVLHLPVRGSGDGGVYTTVADLSALWRAVFAGRVVSPDGVAALTSPRSVEIEKERRYGRGFWLDGSTDGVWLTGSDAGVSCVTSYDPDADLVLTVVSNTSDGAWDVFSLMEDLVG